MSFFVFLFGIIFVKKAIAYIRFSTLAQKSGDSLRRQNFLVDEWLKNNPDYYLEDLKYEDLGYSAFDGSHASKGALYDFMDAVNRGHITSGTTLLIESLDRLSREKINDATERLKNILKAGINVITLSDNVRYTYDSLDDPYILIRAILIAQRANEESEIKSRRMKAAWVNKREEARKTGKILTKTCPKWLKVSNDGQTFDIIEEHKVTLNKIFKMRLKGLSISEVTKTLNKNKIKTLKNTPGGWCVSTVQSLLRNESLIGKYTPSYMTKAKGVKEIENYFPAVISNKLFYDVQEIRVLPFGHEIITNNPLNINIFRSLLKCSECGHSLIVNCVYKNFMGYYKCSMKRYHRCSTPPLRRDFIDDVFIRVLLESISCFGDDMHDENTVLNLQKKIEETKSKLKNILDALQVASEVEALALKMKEVNKELKIAESKLHSFLERNNYNERVCLSDVDLFSKENREYIRHYASKNIKKITVDLRNRKCEVELLSGLKIYNFPLDKKIDLNLFKHSFMYIQGGALVL
ncbi:recombinase family protein [Pantoea sp. Taur]|nr:recombinase family protein [Pantoea sp. Taur]MXP61344.1 recombinase family protein [Pantoea sp. Taur]